MRLSLAADVPKFHLERQRNAKRGDQHGNHKLHRGLHRHFGSESTRNNGLVHINRVKAEHQNEQTARGKRKQERAQSNEQHLLRGFFLGLYNTDHACASFPPPTISMAISSLVVVRASTTPVTCP